MAIALGFTEETLEDAAGTLSFDRGRHYLDAVDDFEATAAEITATVCGTSPYHVSLTARNRQLAGNCSCPYGRGVDVDIAPRECVFVVGLAGSGREELVYALAGASGSSASNPDRGWLAGWMNRHGTASCGRDARPRGPAPQAGR